MRPGVSLALAVLLVTLASVAHANSFSNTITSSVTVQPATNVLITSFTSSASSVTEGSQMSFTATLKNDGGLATSGMIILQLSIAGPTPAAAKQTANGLSPSQSETVIVTLNNATATAGSYTASAVANFIGSDNGNYLSSAAMVGYTVTSSGGSGGGGTAAGGAGAGGGGGGGIPSSPLTVATNVSGTIGSTITYTPTAMTLVVTGTNSTQTAASIRLLNWTCCSLPPAAGYKLIWATNISVTSAAPVVLNITEGYPCSAQAGTVAPYKEVNVAWQPISAYTVNPAQCTVSFSILSSDPMVALLKSNLPVPTITAVPQVAITTAPFLITLPSGSSAASTLGLQNTGTLTETVQLSIPRAFANLLSLSTGSITLLPTSSLNVGLLFNAPANLTLGSYVIPVNISTYINGGKVVVNQTEYIQTTVFAQSSTQPQLINQLSLTNNTQTLSGVIQVKAPATSNLTNVNVQTTLPPGVVKNASQITTYGMSANVSMVNGLFVINWHIDRVPAGSSVYGYYIINRFGQISLLRRTLTNFVQVTPVPASQILRIIEVTLPTLYRYTEGTIGVSLLYTGSQPAVLTMSLAAPPGVAVENQTRIFNITPNQEITTGFGVTSNMTGTVLLNLQIYVPGANVTEQLPVVVLPAVGVIGGTLGNAATALEQNAPVITGAAAVALLAWTLMKLRRRGRGYSPERAKELIRVREQISQASGGGRHD